MDSKEKEKMYSKKLLKFLRFLKNNDVYGKYINALHSLEPYGNRFSFSTDGKLCAANHNPLYVTNLNELNKWFLRTKSPHHVLIYTLLWNETKEGPDFWVNLHNDLMSKRLKLIDDNEKF